VAGCSNFNCGKVVNAGFDVFMVPAEVRQYSAYTIQLEKCGYCPDWHSNDD